MSRGLLARILRHAKEEGWIQDGSVVCDPFGGVFTTGILGAYEGYRVIGVELEQKFVDLAKQNIALHAKKLAALNCPQPVIIQGDSRELCKLLANCDAIISYPPFQGFTHSDNDFQAPHDTTKLMVKGDGYGTSPGQLGAMKPGSIDCVLSSPPYSELGSGNNVRFGKVMDGFKVGSSNIGNGYGTSPGQLGAMKPGDVSAIISSPPYEGTPVIASGVQCNEKSWQAGKDLSGGKSKHYGQTLGQLGETQGETFWSAARDIVEQCHQILKPGGVAMPDGENIDFCNCC